MLKIKPHINRKATHAGNKFREKKLKKKVWSLNVCQIGARVTAPKIGGSGKAHVRVNQKCDVCV